MAPPSYVATQRAVVFADVCKSTQLFEQHGDVKARRVVGHALALLREVVQRHGGTVVKTIGDEIMASFPTPAAAVAAVSEMPPVVNDDVMLNELGLSIKVGLHFGDVLLEQDDVFGDTVNVAARMVSLAKANQIITNGDTLAQLPTHVHARTRPLGPIKVRGKQASLDIVEVLWQQDRHELTLLNAVPGRDFQARTARLVLRYGDRTVEIERGPFKLGRSVGNDLIVRGVSTSREHAHIEFRNGIFVLVDHSTNGTYIQASNTDIIFVHRDHAHLQGEGLICLGQRADDANPGVHFRHLEAF